MYDLHHAQAAADQRQAALVALEAKYVLQQATIRQAEADLNAKAAHAEFASTDAVRYRDLAATTFGTRQSAERALAGYREASTGPYAGAFRAIMLGFVIATLLVPARPGDTLTAVSEVVEITPSRSRPDRGTVRVRSETRNQHGEVVQTLTARLVVPRPAAPNADNHDLEAAPTKI